MAKKMTKKDYFNTIKAVPAIAANADLVAFIDRELELLEKKNASRKSEMTETQKENAELAEKVVEFMASAGSAVTVAEVRKYMGLSSQKVTPLMKNLVKAGRVTAVEDKKTNYYSLVA